MVSRLYPPPAAALPLAGLYLREESCITPDGDRPMVYSNFIASLDGRIAVTGAGGGSPRLPPALTNPRDWRLFSELAAQADMLLVSPRYIRELAAGTVRDVLDFGGQQDLRAWRARHGLRPEPAITIPTTALDLPLSALRAHHSRGVYVATGRQADTAGLAAVERAGARVLFAGERKTVRGRLLIEALAHAGYRRIYSIAGPRILAMLVEDQVLRRLYLTHAHRLLGGAPYRTLLEGDLLVPPVDLALRALYHDAGDGLDQCFAVYDVR